MARYTVRYVTHAEKQRNGLPNSHRSAFDSAVRSLEADPYKGAQDHKDGSWSIGYGYGFIYYVVSAKIVTVTVLRIV